MQRFLTRTRPPFGPGLALRRRPPTGANRSASRAGWTPCGSEGQSRLCHASVRQERLSVRHPQTEKGTVVYNTQRCARTHTCTSTHAPTTTQPRNVAAPRRYKSYHPSTTPPATSSWCSSIHCRDTHGHTTVSLSLADGFRHAQSVIEWRDIWEEIQFNGERQHGPHRGNHHN